MKITCNFCKTEYVLAATPTTPVECAICGHIQTVAVPRRHNSFLLVFASICALLAALIFAAVIVTQDGVRNQKNNPLVATVANVRTVIDAYGEPHLVVSGRIQNRSSEIYGVPNLVFILQDEKDMVIGTQKFLPPASLLDVGEFAEFSHTLSPSANGVRKVSVELEQNKEQRAQSTKNR